LQRRGPGDRRNNGAIRVDNDIANATIKGSLIGNATNPALITARGSLTPTATADLAIGTLTVNGRVEFGLIYAGVDTTGVSGAPKNADAQIGPVTVGHDWIASELVAGVIPGNNGFGGTNVQMMNGSGIKNVGTVFSKLTSVEIGGQLIGFQTPGPYTYGFVAQNIGRFKLKGGTTTFNLTAGNSNDDILFPDLMGQFRIREI
jgi:hypothetical protein